MKRKELESPFAEALRKISSDEETDIEDTNPKHPDDKPGWKGEL